MVNGLHLSSGLALLLISSVIFGYGVTGIFIINNPLIGAFSASDTNFTLLVQLLTSASVASIGVGLAIAILGLILIAASFNWFANEKVKDTKYNCGKCHAAVIKNQTYCSSCGERINWS